MFCAPISTKINSIYSSDEPLFSLEFRPPLEKDIPSFFDSISNLLDKTTNSFLFLSLTAHANNQPTNLSIQNSSTSIAIQIKRQFPHHNLLLHLTYSSLIGQNVPKYLEFISQNGINDIFALSGDPLNDQPLQAPPSQFNSVELIKLIRRHLPPSSSIAVAAYPQGHPLAKSFSADLAHLKMKLNNENANFAICQFILDNPSNKFRNFVAICRQSEIHHSAPILPGILLYSNFSALLKLSELSKIPIPPAILRQLWPIRQNDLAIQSFSLWNAFWTCKSLLANPAPKNPRIVHIFTANQFTMTKSLLLKLGFLLYLDTKMWKMEMEFISQIKLMNFQSKFHAKIQSNLSANVIHRWGNGRGRGNCGIGQRRGRSKRRSGICLKQN